MDTLPEGMEMRVKPILLISMAILSCAEYVWYHPYKMVEERNMDIAQCELEAKRYALSIPPNVNIINPPPPVIQSGGAMYIDPVRSYAELTQSTIGYAITIAMQEAAYFNACMKALGYKKVKKEEQEK